MPKTTWGNWTLNTNNACLEYVDPRDGAMIYQIAVDEMKNSANILDWLFQVEEKTWASSEDLGNLVTAVSEILGRGVAGGGVDNPIDPREALANKYGIR